MASKRKQSLTETLIKFVEKETGMKYKVKPQFAKKKPRWVKERAAGARYYNVLDVEETGEGVKIRRAVVKAPKIRGTITAKGKKYPAVQPVIHELVENLYMQNRLQSASKRHMREVARKAHQFAAKKEKTLTRKFLKIKT
jgi:hypothetical protein